ncbi:MAG: hypothetical protein JNJ73_06030 [Hyphomonadaceae bacterium]|nr:hypothetical protein [Hyphomonadaceae bacterium]
MMRVLLLACVLWLAPACATVPGERPAASSHSMEARAVALLQAYAVILDEAAKVAADPATPLAVKQTLARAERVATPAAEALVLALRAHARAQSDGSELQLVEAMRFAEAALMSFAAAIP